MDTVALTTFVQVGAALGEVVLLAGSILPQGKPSVTVTPESADSTSTAPLPPPPQPASTEVAVGGKTPSHTRQPSSLAEVVVAAALQDSGEVDTSKDPSIELRVHWRCGGGQSVRCVNG